jgi:cyclase
MREIAEGVVVSTDFRRLTVGAIATGKGIVCIDVPPYPRDARLWRSLLMERFKQPIKMVILTDAHPDRLLGLYWYEEACIVAQTESCQLIRSLPTGIVDQVADAISTNSDERSSFIGVRLRYPRVTFSQQMTAYVENVGIPLMAMPGPTPGNLWLHLPDDRLVFTGDSVVVNDAPYMTNTHSKDWLNSLTMLRRPRFAVDVVVPGRGPLVDKEASLPISEFLRYLRRRVQSLIRSGRPRTDIEDVIPDVLAHTPYAPADHTLIEGRIRAGMEAVYDEFLLEAQAEASMESEAVEQG